MAQQINLKRDDVLRISFTDSLGIEQAVVVYRSADALYAQAEDTKETIIIEGACTKVIA
jgi:hypothetical protein